MPTPGPIPLGEARHAPGSISQVLAGRTVELVLTDDRYLIVRCIDGHEAVIEWTSDGPMLVRVDVRIMLAAAPEALAGVGLFGGGRR